jgi:hypothetical protein
MMSFETQFDAIIEYVVKAKQSALRLLDFETEERANMLSGKASLLELRSQQLDRILSECVRLVNSGGCVDVTEALVWSESYELAEGWDGIGSLHVDAAVSIGALKSAVNACWSIATLDGVTADDKVWRLCAVIC